MGEDVKLGIGGEDVGFGAMLEELKAKSIETADTIKEKFESINQVFEKVQGAFVAFTAVLAGGEMFKEVIGSTVGAVVASTQLGKQFGISTTAASQLRVALDATHVTQEQFSNANQKMTVTLGKNEGAFKNLGVQTRDSTGAFRNSVDIQLDVNEALMKVKAGTDRNIEGTKIYGKGWLEASESLRMTKEAMAEAKVTADALGLTLGTEDVERISNYRDSMVQTHEVIEALGKVVADAVMPYLTTMGKWFGENGPMLVGVMRTAVQILATAFQALVDTVKVIVQGIASELAIMNNVIDSVFGTSSDTITGMEFFKNVLRVIGFAFVELKVEIAIAVEVIVEAVEVMADSFIRLSATSTAMFNALAGKGTWSAVAAAWDKGTKDAETHMIAHEAKMVQIAKDGMKQLNDVLMDQAVKPTVTPTDDADKGQHAKDAAAKLAALMGELAAELAAKKAAWDADQMAHGTFIQFSLEQEKAFWDAAKSRAAEGTSQRTEIDKNSSKLQSQIRTAAYKDELAALTAQEASYKTNLQKKLAVAIEIAQKIAIAEGASSAPAQKAGAEVLAVTKEILAQRLALEEAYVKSSGIIEMSRIDAAEREAQLQNNLGHTTNAELLAQEQGFENERYQLKVAALARQIALLADDPTANIAKIQQLMDQRYALEAAYDAKVDQLRIKSIEDNNKEWKSMFATMQTGFTTTMQNFLKGNTSLSASIKGLFTDVEKSVIDTLSNIAAKIVSNTIQAIAMGKMQKLEEQNSNAVKAGSAAWASAANIPYVGWILAPAAGAAAYAGVMAMAEGGYDIPAGVNPLVQAHAKEMILPQKHSDVIRSLADNGPPAAAAGAMHLHVPALDGHSVQKVLTRNAKHVTKAMRKINARFMK